MLTIIWNNLTKSDLTRDIVQQRLDRIIERFPDLAQRRVTVTLSMQNSPQQAGPDTFNIKFRVSEGRYRGLAVEQSSHHLYAALALVVESLLERLNRHGDKTRMRRLHQARRDPTLKYLDSGTSSGSGESIQDYDDPAFDDEPSRDLPAWPYQSRA